MSIPSTVPSPVTGYPKDITKTIIIIAANADDEAYLTSVDDFFSDLYFGLSDTGVTIKSVDGVPFVLPS